MKSKTYTIIVTVFAIVLVLTTIHLYTTSYYLREKNDVLNLEHNEFIKNLPIIHQTVGVSIEYLKNEDRSQLFKTFNITKENLDITEGLINRGNTSFYYHAIHPEKDYIYCSVAIYYEDELGETRNMDYSFQFDKKGKLLFIQGGDV